MESASIAPLHKTHSAIMVSAAFAAVTGLVGAFAYQRHVHSELNTMPQQDRSALVSQGLAILQTTCEHAGGSELRNYCRAQAELVAQLPECDAACLATCRRFGPQPSR